jgi:ATP-dependent helicase/nuclease subunit A
MSHRVIIASAGSGKTYRLVLWYLGLLRQGFSPETILATTFTRKAAGEILSRIFLRLAEAAGDEAKARQLAIDLNDNRLTADDCREMLARLCKSIHRLSVSTIDSFLNRVAQSFRLELGVPAGVRIIDEQSASAATIRAMAIDALLGNEPPEALLLLLRRLHHDAAKRSVSQAIDEIVSKLHGLYQQAQDRRLWCQIDVPDELLVETEIVTAIDVLTQMGPSVPLTKAGKPVANWDKAWRKLLEAVMLRQWELAGENRLCIDVLAGAETSYNNAEITDAWRAAVLPLARHARAQQMQRVADQTSATYDLLERYDLHIDRLKREQCVMFFSDLSNLLARKLPALGDDLLTEVAYRLDARVSHLLLDEFQDTSIDQWTILKRLAEEITSYSDGSRRFFCVGDPKQSIYGWRGGCAELIEQLSEQLPLEDEHFEVLKVSYRSSQVVLDVVNDVFRKLGDVPVLGGATTRDDSSTSSNATNELARAFADSYEDHVAAKKQLPGYVEMLSTPAAAILTGTEDPSEEARQEERNHYHAQQVAQRIEQIVRQCPDRTVGVLTSTNDFASKLIDLLRQRGLPASGEGGTALTDDPAINLILAALTLADHPGHSAAAFEVAQSPLAELLGLRSHRPDDVALAATRIRRRLMDQGYGATISDWARALAPHCDQRSVLRLTQLIEMADDYQPLVTLRPRHFVEHVRARTVEEPTPAAIRVMTVHRSKGLEFDIVVLPQLHRILQVAPDVCVQRLNHTGPITGVFCGLNKDVIAHDSRLAEAYEESRNRELRDDVCSLYVAMTRAIHALHLFLPPAKAKADGSAGSRGLSHAAILLGALFKGDDEPSGNQTYLTRGDGRWFDKLQNKQHDAAPGSHAWRTLSASVLSDDRLPSRSMRVVSPSSLEMGGAISVSDLLDLEPAMQRVRGTIIHEWFALIDWLGGEDDTGPSDEELLRAARRAVPECDDAAASVYLLEFRRMLTHRAVRDVLTRGAGDGGLELWRERAFAVRVEGKLLQGRFDRVTIHRAQAGGTVATLIDFKTDRVGPEGVAPIIERYAPQIRAYRAALSRLLGGEGVTVRAGLLLVGAGLWCEV